MEKEPQKKKKNKNWPLYLILVVLVLVAIGMIAYPAVSNALHVQQKDMIRMDYESKVEAQDDSAKQRQLELARAYNKALLLGDEALREFNYTEILNPNGTGVMGFIEIPRIEVNMPIYHGDTNEGLEKGASHLLGSSLPVGGESTHSVVSAHTGLAGEKMFTDLDALEVGDVFYLHVLSDVYAYEVDNIAVVVPSDTALLAIEKGSDQCTLFTCTPYAINTHRLLVRGHRIPYEKAIEVQEYREKTAAPIESQWQETYLDSLKLGLLIGGALVVFLVIVTSIHRAVKKRKKAVKADE